MARVLLSSLAMDELWLSLVTAALREVPIFVGCLKSPPFDRMSPISAWRCRILGEAILARPNMRTFKRASKAPLTNLALLLLLILQQTCTCTVSDAPVETAYVDATGDT